MGLEARADRKEKMEIGKEKWEKGNMIGMFCKNLWNLAKEYTGSDDMPVVMIRISLL